MRGAEHGQRPSKPVKATPRSNPAHRGPLSTQRPPKSVTDTEQRAQRQLRGTNHKSPTSISHGRCRDNCTETNHKSTTPGVLGRRLPYRHCRHRCTATGLGGCPGPGRDPNPGPSPIASTLETFSSGYLGYPLRISFLSSILLKQKPRSLLALKSPKLPPRTPAPALFP